MMVVTDGNHGGHKAHCPDDDDDVGPLFVISIILSLESYIESSTIRMCAFVKWS